MLTSCLTAFGKPADVLRVRESARPRRPVRQGAYRFARLTGMPKTLCRMAEPRQFRRLMRSRSASHRRILPLTMQNLPGFRDFYPDDCARRNYILSTWREVARRYGFVEYDGPVLEPIEFYEKKSGGELLGQLFDFYGQGRPSRRHAAGDDADACTNGGRAREGFQEAAEVVLLPAVLSLRKAAARTPARILPVQCGHHRRKLRCGGC